MRRRRKKDQLNTMDKILIIMAIALMIFTIAMVIIFCVYQSVPDSLITAFFASFGAEGGFMAVIMVAKKITEGKNEAEQETDIF